MRYNGLVKGRVYMDKIKLSERLKQLRNSKGLFQKEVADKLGIKQNTLSGYENGTRSPDNELLKDIADFYNVTLDYLLGRSDDPTLTEKENKDFLEIKKLIDKMEREGKHNELEQLKSYTKWLAHDLEED
ncbi:helix-turn-helix domain-containing protein [Gracilibacillus thailandensis]|uniref:Helix-turn-helix domain-containing protein n=2 Tax=Gracilibacillus thailandensis TaxID=563735 RepID=A0A6N7QYW9_9BACI|nr:helix-turn-helix domain-containing protein [Gracilibacillus thailandensis]